jgi:DNA invertase Pin-like site-specific DNA recombinase
MIAAIYARKSTEQNGVAEEAKSVTRQIEHAKAYAAKKGWRVIDAHIYTDDGISGVEFVNRPGFIRLMSALKPKPPFQALIMSEESRLGREQIKTAYALQQLTDAAVQVWFYLTDEERKLNSAMDKIMDSLAGFASELERERAQQRTYDAMLRKAKDGYVTGGRVFGYDNCEIVGTDGTRSHVELRINDKEAAIVLQIFRLYADGHGFTSIAKRSTLRALLRRVPAQRPISPMAGSARRSVKSSCDGCMSASRSGDGRRSAPHLASNGSADRIRTGSLLRCRTCESSPENSGRKPRPAGSMFDNCTFARPMARCMAALLTGTNRRTC